MVSREIKLLKRILPTQIFKLNFAQYLIFVLWYGIPHLFYSFHTTMKLLTQQILADFRKV